MPDSVRKQCEIENRKVKDAMDLLSTVVSLHDPIPPQMVEFILNHMDGIAQDIIKGINLVGAPKWLQEPYERTTELSNIDWRE